MRKTLIPNAAIAGLMLAAILGGCEKSTPEDSPTAANDRAGDVTPSAAEGPAELPAPLSPSAPAVAATGPTEVAPQPDVTEPRAAPPAPDAQMLDDADATGMTARVSRDTPAVNDTAPQ